MKHVHGIIAWWELRILSIILLLLIVFKMFFFLLDQRLHIILLLDILRIFQFASLEVKLEEVFLEEGLGWGTVLLLLIQIRKVFSKFFVLVH